jgi:hypothetical protein
MNEDGQVSVRSFRSTFRLERRIHKIDRWRIPIPFGIPLRGVGYTARVELGMVLLGRLPGLGQLIEAINPLVRFGIIPLAGAYICTVIELDGRPAPAALRSLIRMRLAPARLAAWRRRPADQRVDLGQVLIAPDERSSRLRSAVITGPARVLVFPRFHASVRRRTVRLEPDSGPLPKRGKVISIDRGSRIVIR